MFTNLAPRYELLSQDALLTIERGWRRLVSEIGIEFLHPDALEHFRRAGQQVDGTVVRFDPDFVRAQVELAPSTFQLCARNPARSVPIGGDHMVFVPVQGPPFCRRGDVRREATLADFADFCRLAQLLDDFDTAGGLSVRAERRAARLAAPGHRAHPGHADRQALAGLPDLRRRGARLARDRAHGVRRPDRLGERACTRSSTSIRHCASTIGCSRRS